MFRQKTAHTVEVLAFTQVSLSNFMVWTVRILHTWALWAGSVNLVTAQEFCPVYYFIWAYTGVLHTLTLTSHMFLCALARPIARSVGAGEREGWLVRLRRQRDNALNRKVPRNELQMRMGQKSEMFQQLAKQHCGQRYCLAGSYSPILVPSMDRFQPATCSALPAEGPKKSVILHPRRNSLEYVSIAYTIIYSIIIREASERFTLVLQ